MDAATLHTTSERLDKDRVKLRVEVPETTLAPAIDAVYKRWASEVKIPGFRKGKVPRALIDSRVGPDAVRQEALRDALPDLYREAMRSEELEAIAPPDIELVEFENGGPLVFEATVDVRPEVSVPDLGAIQVEAPPSEVTEEDVDQQLERLRDRFAELETVSREVRRGDHALIDLRGFTHDQPVEGASAPDYLYEVGSGTGPPKLDQELEGNRAGAILKFTDAPPRGSPLGDQQISFTVLLKEVKAKKLPPLDDEFAKTVGEFDSLDDLRADLRNRLAEVNEAVAEEELRRRALGALVDASDLEPPEKLVESEFQHRLEHFEDELRQAGLTIDDYGREAQLTELEIRREIRDQARLSVKAELLLEEIARREEVDVSQEDIGREIALVAARASRDPKEVADEVLKGGRLGAIVGDIMRRKALDHVVGAVHVLGKPTDER